MLQGKGRLRVFGAFAEGVHNKRDTSLESQRLKFLRTTGYFASTLTDLSSLGFPCSI